MTFNGKVVLVTGASSGIGAGIALKFAEEGANVAMVGRNLQKLNNVAAQCEESGKKPLVITADITKDDEAKRLVSETIKHFGKLDVLVNCAGIARRASILSEDAVKIFDDVMSLNLRAAVVLTNLAAPHLVETKGNIINIVSIAAKKVYDDVGVFQYCTSKAGLDHFSRCIALELAPKGVRVNSILPGPVITDMPQNLGMSEEQTKAAWELGKSKTALKRIVYPVEVADLVAFVASDKARSITGSSLVTDNGYLLT